MAIDAPHGRLPRSRNHCHSNALHTPAPFASSRQPFAAPTYFYSAGPFARPANQPPQTVPSCLPMFRGLFRLHSSPARFALPYCWRIRFVFPASRGLTVSPSPLLQSRHSKLHSVDVGEPDGDGLSQQGCRGRLSLPMLHARVSYPRRSYQALRPLLVPVPGTGND